MAYIDPGAGSLIWQALLAGVLPRTFRPQLPAPAAVSQLPPGEVEAYHATMIRPPSPTDFGVQLFYVIARTRLGVTVAQVRSELETLRADVQRAYPKLASAPRLRVTPFADVLVGHARRPLLILFGCVLLVLTIACVNIASLQLARASARRKEVAVRAAIGAGRGRVLRQFAVENLLLASAGGIVGLLVARAAVSSMVQLLPYAIPRLTETTIDARVLTFASIASGDDPHLIPFAHADGAARRSFVCECHRLPNLRGQRNNLGKFLFAQLARHRTKNTRSHRLAGIVD